MSPVNPWGLGSEGTDGPGHTELVPAHTIGPGDRVAIWHTVDIVVDDPEDGVLFVLTMDGGIYRRHRRDTVAVLRDGGAS